MYERDLLVCFFLPWGKPLEGPGLCPFSLVLPTVLSMEEVASPAEVPEVPWLGLRVWSAWERGPVLPAFLPGW